MCAGVAFLLSPCVPAFAQEDEGFDLQPNNFGADAWFLGPFVAEKWEHEHLPEDYVREQDNFVGRFDLNGDGVDEIMVQSFRSGWCGSIGCATYVLQRQGDTWTTIGGGNFFGVALTERVCGYRSLVSRDGIDRWNGSEYEFAYCFPHENQCRSIAIYYDEPRWPTLERLDPKNGLIEPRDCPDPEAAAKLPQGHWMNSAGRAVAEFSPTSGVGGPPYHTPDNTFDLLPGNYGSDADFISQVAAERFEPDPLPEDYSRERNIHIGRVDVNGNGMPELFIANYHYDACRINTFVDGCPFLLFQRDGDEWREIGSGRLDYAVFLLAETVDGYHSIRSPSGYYRWNGRSY